MLITKQNSNNLVGLFSCLLAIISVCLTAFNLYLLAWIWSATGGVEQTASNQLTFAGKIHSKQSIEAPNVLMGPGGDEPQGNLQISSKKSVHFGSSLVLSAQEKQIKFPDGLIVRTLNASSLGAQIHCDPSSQQQHEKQKQKQKQKCQLIAPKLKLTHPNGVDFMRSSIETPRVLVKRLHSPTNKLNLMSLRQSTRLESISGGLQLHSLADIHLGSRNSTVILDAKTIKLNSKQANGNKINKDNAYKLCICLNDEERRGQQWTLGNAGNSINNNGLVFGVKSNLNCFKFTQSFCNNNNNNNNNYNKQSG